MWQQQQEEQGAERRLKEEAGAEASKQHPAADANVAWGKSDATGCLTRRESESDCGADEILCMVSSPPALAEFSSPEACQYHHKVGFVPDDPRQDLFIADMTWAEAKEWCDKRVCSRMLAYADVC